MGTLKKIGLFILLGCIVLLSAGFIVVSVYEDDIKKYALTQLGKQLKTDIKVKEVHLTLWDQFPSASLQFDDVYIEETFEKKDTLIYAESVFLNFSISDFLSGNYTVKEIAVENSTISLKRKKNGDDNYHFWKESDGAGSEFSIDLSAVQLTNSLVTFDDQVSNTDLKVLARNGDVFGTITDQTLDLTGDIDTQVFFLSVSDQSYISNKTLAGTVGLRIDLKNDIYTFSESLLSVNELPLAISGTIALEDKFTLLNLQAESKQADLSSVIKNLPAFVQDKLSSFSSSGTFASKIKLTGAVASGKIPAIEASFSLKNGQLTNLDSGIELENINTEGTYSVAPKKEDLLSFSSLTCELGSGEFSGKGKVSRLSNPFINAQITGKIELEAFHEFFNFKEIDHMSGTSQLAINYKGNFGKNWEPSATSIRAADVSGNCTVADGIIKLSRNPHEFTDVSGQLLLTNGDAAVNQLSGIVEGSDFRFDGFFRNLMPYVLIENEKLTVESSLVSDFLDFNTLLSSSESSDESYIVNLPEEINFNLAVDIGKLTFRDFKASDIHASTKLSQSQLKIHPISMKTAEGEFKAEITATQQKNGDFIIRSTGNMNQVDITQLFHSFENFQQEFITEQHLKGTATSDFSFNATMSNKLDIHSETVDVVANIQLENGELINHSSIMEIGDYMKNKKLVSALTNMDSFSRKLDHIKFSELTNKIIIKNERISIPKMNIKSDALDIMAEGTHFFDNHIDYSVGFDIADLTTKKEYSDDEKGISKFVFVSMTGTTSNPEFGYDQLAVKEQRKENREEEKQKIKQLLKDEFSKKQTTKKSNDEKQQPTKNSVVVEWSEEPKKSDTSIKKSEKKKTIFSVEPSSENEDDDDF